MSSKSVVLKEKSVGLWVVECKVRNPKMQRAGGGLSSRRHPLGVMGFGLAGSERREMR